MRKCRLHKVDLLSGDGPTPREEGNGRRAAEDTESCGGGAKDASPGPSDGTAETKGWLCRQRAIARTGRRNEAEAKRGAFSGWLRDPDSPPPDSLGGYSARAVYLLDAPVSHEDLVKRRRDFRGGNRCFTFG